MSHVIHLLRVYTDNREDAVRRADAFIDNCIETERDIDGGYVEGGVDPDGNVFSCEIGDASLTTEQLQKRFNVDEYVEGLQRTIGNYEAVRNEIVELVNKLPKREHDKLAEYHLQNRLRDLMNSKTNGTIDVLTDYIYEYQLSEPGISQAYDYGDEDFTKKPFILFINSHC